MNTRGKVLPDRRIINSSMLTGVSFRAELARKEIMSSAGRRVAKDCWPICPRRHRAMLLRCLLSVVLLTPVSFCRAQIPVIGVINWAAKKIVVALDLKVQRMQTATLDLQNAEKELEIVMEHTKLDSITGWVNRQKDLYDEYYQELWMIKSAINAYERVADMIAKAARIADQYKRMYSVIRQDPHFTPEEVKGMADVLTGILQVCADNIDRIGLVIHAFVTQMADADRLRIVDEAGSRIDRNLADLQVFYQRSMLLSMARARQADDLAATKLLYGIR